MLKKDNEKLRKFLIDTSGLTTGLSCLENRKSETLLKVSEQYKSREEQFTRALDMMKQREALLEQKVSSDYIIRLM